MANAKSKFRAAVAKAKNLYKSGRYKTFADAVKAAYKSLPGKKASRKVSGVKKVIGKKRSRQPKSKIVIVGSTSQSLGAAISSAKNIIASRIAACELGKFKATTKRAKRNYSKKIAAYKKQYNKLT